VTCQTDALATVYAKSLFELASDAGGNDKVVEIADELEQICELLRQDKEVRLFFTSPIIDVPKRSETISAIFSNRVTDLTLRFLLVLNNKGRLNHLESISVAFDLLVQEAFGRVEVDVFTPTAIDADSINIIKGKVQSMLGKEPVLHPYVDKKMLGGLKLRIGDQLIDGSVQTKLRRLSESIKNSGGTAIREQFETYLEDN
jgi:F-type H+-transporting ATPase subunit delta|tara:strand:+ start:93 stop:695 length:603 start_codon:yes stop_codon:yes gene_type:complete